MANNKEDRLIRFFNVCVLDIETSDLAAVGAGFLTAAVVKPLGYTERVFRYDEFKCKPAHEGKMLSSLIRELGQYDMVIGHNIDRFDLNYIRSRAIVLGVPFNVRPIVYDTLKAFRRCGFLTRPNGFGKPTASLAFVTDFLGIPQEKTALYPREHWQTVWQTQHKERRAAIDGLVNHCKKDVFMNEQAFNVLFPLDTNFNLKRLR